jgi:hypothetical protein
MTKRELITAIQVEEAKAWKQLGEVKDAFGVDSEQVARARSAWSSLFNLREQLGLPGLSLLELLEMDLLPARFNPQAA